MTDSSTETHATTLHALLDRIIAHPEDRDEVERIILETYSQQCAVLVLDMSGFSRTTMRHGIVSFLLMIHQMKLFAVPCIQEFGGRVVKAEADNLFCLFEDVSQAVEASLELVHRLNTVNVLLPADRKLYVSIGIGYGRILDIGGCDLFGSEVNLASKLGEDVAGQGQVLLTTAAFQQVAASDIHLVEEQVSISGLDLTYYNARAAGNGTLVKRPR